VGTPRTDPDELLTSPQAARLACLNRQYFAKLLREGRGPVHQLVGDPTQEKRIVIIRRGDLDAWLKSREG
jgi:hypothetical protein